MKKSLNYNYFVDESRIASDHITQLNNNEIFVFGSNVLGEHNGGAALYALRHFGAVNGQAEGIQGRSYAIPTHGNSFKDLKAAVKRFTEYAAMNPQTHFMLTAVGCGTAGYQVGKIAPLFRKAFSLGNVYVPKSFAPYMPED